MNLKPDVDTLMAHRYLYYILCKPVISDYQYDMLEKQVTQKYDSVTGKFINLYDDNHPVMKPGSSDPKSYSRKQIKLAKKFLMDLE